MGYRALSKEEIDRVMYEIENTPARRIAAELRLARDLVSELRRGGYLPRKVRIALERIPKQNEKQAWAIVAGIAVAEEPITDFMREDFE